MICLRCINYTENMNCKAFPNGIPTEIVLSDSHSKPLESQGNEIVFKDELIHYRETKVSTASYEELEFNSLNK